MRNILRIFLLSQISRNSAFSVPLMYHHNGQNRFFQTCILFSMNFKDTMYPADLSEGFLHMKGAILFIFLAYAKQEGNNKQKAFTYYENVVMVCIPKDLRKRWVYFG